MHLERDDDSHGRALLAGWTGWAGLRLEVAAGKTAGQAAGRQARDIARWR
jgi:hypothetical protein